MGKKILFILKKRETTTNASEDDWNYATYSNSKSTGLSNSVRHVGEMFKQHFQADSSKIIHVQDNNSIDKEVTDYDPDIVIIEALWVVPEKFKILHKLHPHVEWIIRLHSDTPFLANEGIAMQWIREYMRLPKVRIAVNSSRIQKELKKSIGCHTMYLPNYYNVEVQ